MILINKTLRRGGHRYGWCAYEGNSKRVGRYCVFCGGQGSDQAIRNLQAIVKEARNQKAPWPLLTVFSYARAFQNKALTISAGDEANQQKAREAFMARLQQATQALT